MSIVLVFINFDDYFDIHLLFVDFCGFNASLSCLKYILQTVFNATRFFTQKNSAGNCFICILMINIRLVSLMILMLKMNPNSLSQSILIDVLLTESLAFSLLSFFYSKGYLLLLLLLSPAL